MGFACSFFSSLSTELDAESAEKKPEMKFSWKNSLAPVKNTFIHYDTPEYPQGSRRRCTSSPAVLAKIAVQANAKIAVAAENAQAIIEKIPRQQSWADESTDAEGSVDFSIDSEELPSQTRDEKVLAHETGACRPCAYFSLKGDGCRRGDNCEYCHFCSMDDVKDQKRSVKREARAQKRVAASAARREAREAAKQAKALAGKRSKGSQLST